MSLDQARLEMPHLYATLRGLLDSAEGRAGGGEFGLDESREPGADGGGESMFSSAARLASK